MMKSMAIRAYGPRSALAGAFLVAWSLILFACGDDPKPGPLSGGSGTGAPEGEADRASEELSLAERPRLDALRQAGSWQVTVSAPRVMPAGFRPTTVLLEGPDGSELARQPFDSDSDSANFTLDHRGPLRCVLLDEGGRRLERDFELP